MTTQSAFLIDQTRCVASQGVDVGPAGMSLDRRDDVAGAGGQQAVGQQAEPFAEPAPIALRYARQVRLPAPAAVASRWQ